MSEQFEIKTVADIADLTPEQFERMLPDFQVWFILTKALEKKLGAKSRSFIWVDDGKPGELHSIDLFVDGQVEPFRTIIGPAHPEAA